MPGNGPLGATIPAVIDGMALALETKGTMRLEQVMQPAIELADGFPMYQYLHNILVSERKATEQYEWSAKTYYPPGRIPEPGEVFRQPNLAKTLRAIVAEEKAAYARRRDRVAAIRAGRDAFYKGDIARRIAEADKAAGGVFTYEDLASFHGHIEKPVSTSFHGYDVYKAGPWNQGPVLLQALNILEGVDLAGAGAFSTETIHQMHEAIKLAYDDRNAYYGDPAFTSVPIAGLLSKSTRRSGARSSARRRRWSTAWAIRSGSTPRSHLRPYGTRRIHRERSRPWWPATRRASMSSTRTGICSAPRPARDGSSAARSSPATPACRSRTA